MDLKEYGAELTAKLSGAWKLARECVGKAQKKQTAHNDQQCRPPNFKIGEHVFVFKPSEKTGEAIPIG